jgi:hypothetical protein
MIYYETTQSSLPFTARLYVINPNILLLLTKSKGKGSRAVPVVN